MTPDLLTIDDLCQRFRKSRWTIRKMELAGKLPERVPLPGHPRWRARDIQALIDNQPTGRVFFGSHRRRA